MPCTVLTITALTTLPLFIVPFGKAFFTVPTTTSPMFPVLTLLPPSTLITKSSRAPELSATF